MGRRAKYLTAASKATARRESDQKYSQSENGQIVRAAARRAQYLSKTGRNDYPSPPKCIPHLPRLPVEIHRLYHLPLPESEKLYRDACGGAAYLDLSSIPRWMEAPPFAADDDDTDPYSTNYHKFTTSLGLVLNGVCMRQQQEHDQQRRLDFNAYGWAVSIECLRAEVVQLLKEFEELDLEMYHPYHASRQYAMLQHYVRWQAHTIYNLYYLKFLN
ncbi:hypothetical protein B0H19DRAFT_1250296 [Mycena capillaripes]|nr:hypothetical protein B0H19DRAFT_1250296 [Mycena capillaripes]